MKNSRNSTGAVTANTVWTLAVGIVVAAIFGGALWLDAPDHGPAANTTADITVYKNKYCGCCHKWIEHLEAHGLTVAVNNVDSTARVRNSVGVPNSMASCHTAIAGDIWVEGHVPADLIQRVLDEKPAGVVGIAVPGMPMGSPGMEGPNPVTYDVVTYADDGSTSVYASREGLAEVPQ